MPHLSIGCQQGNPHSAPHVGGATGRGGHVARSLVAEGIALANHGMDIAHPRVRPATQSDEMCVVYSPHAECWSLVREPRNPGWLPPTARFLRRVVAHDRLLLGLQTDPIPRGSCPVIQTRINQVDVIGYTSPCTNVLPRVRYRALPLGSCACRHTQLWIKQP